MRQVLVPVALALALAESAPAQGTSADLLAQAKAFYAQLEIERALPLLRQLLSPGWPFEINRAQRVEAYTYMGASLALTGRNDSALVYFRAALEWDPFTDLDAARFTPAQVRLFTDARRRTFAVAVRPVAPSRVDPRTERVLFTVVTTHPARLRAAVRSADSARQVELFTGESDGLRELRWDGLLADGRLAPPGRYELTLSGTSRVLTRADSERIFFDLRHDLESLEDTLPGLGPRDLLPEAHTAAAARGDLLRGLGVAVAALVIAGGVSNDDLGNGGEGGAQVVAGVAAVTGVVTFLAHRRPRAIPGNVAENERRRATRAAENEAIRRRNAERIGRTVLIIEPAAGAEP